MALVQVLVIPRINVVTEKKNFKIKIINK
ncbi:hypothetical protein RB653_007135 [Dictyostelium firmibasis]|uniref:Uncharacterized protein n=1 Tax=Dictyostelium firmibasis TaxID=79012 RepID=A0AAN7TN39_9MYCE